MATHFQIIKGKSYQFFNQDGTLTNKLKNNLFENCWYMTTDTAEVYIALRNENDNLTLKKINEVDDIKDSIDISELRDTVSSLNDRITVLENSSFDFGIDEEIEEE